MISNNRLKESGPRKLPLKGLGNRKASNIVSSDLVRVLSSFKGLFSVGARAGMITGVTQSGPFLANRFLDKKLAEG